MSNELKPVITKEDISLVWDAEDGTGIEAGEILLDKIHNINQPLYAIPEGYHIVAIDPEQEQRDNLERHNEKVKLRGDQLTAAYRAGYNKSPLSMHYTDDEISEYNQGQGDRQREREA
ncbi:MAG: hypothetical protein JKY50_00770 [Oleispira sp.]|nr:hypothetical protein [Oleispira sp.]